MCHQFERCCNGFMLKIAQIMPVILLTIGQTWKHWNNGQLTGSFVKEALQHSEAIQLVLVKPRLTKQ